MVLKLQLEETAAPVAPPSTDAPAPQPEAPHEDQTVDKEKRQERGEKYAEWLKPPEV